MCCNYPGIKLEPAIRDKTKFNICHHMFTSSTQLQKRSFHVVETTRRSAKCRKMKNARAKRAKLFFFVVKYANLWRRSCLSSLLGSLRNDHSNGNNNATNQWFDSLKEEISSCCTCGTLFGAMFWWSLPHHEVKFFTFEALTTTLARISKSSTLCVYMKSIRAKQAKVLHFVYLVQRDQNGR